MTRRTQLNNFIDSLYIPVSLRGQAAQLRRIIAENDYRPIGDEDADTMREHCLIIETKGKGLRQSFAAYHVCRVDIGEVGPDMADIAIYYEGSYKVLPKRVNRKNIKINILSD